MMNNWNETLSALAQRAPATTPTPATASIVDAMATAATAVTGTAGAMAWACCTFAFSARRLADSMRSGAALTIALISLIDLKRFISCFFL